MSPKLQSQTLDTSGGNLTIWMRFSATLLVLCGLIYPAITTWFTGMVFPYQAGGSLILQDSRVVGSELVGQPFSSNRYFIGRPSAVGYDPRLASGSNLAGSNPALRERVQKDAQAIARREGIMPQQIPSDLLAASGSGLDPHITPEAARIQVARVARVRNLALGQVQQLVETHTEHGLLGHPRVHVLELNLALDALSK